MNREGQTEQRTACDLCHIKPVPVRVRRLAPAAALEARAVLLEARAAQLVDELRLSVGARAVERVLRVVNRSDPSKRIGAGSDGAEGGPASDDDDEDAQTDGRVTAALAAWAARASASEPDVAGVGPVHGIVSTVNARSVLRAARPANSIEIRLDLVHVYFEVIASKRPFFDRSTMLGLWDVTDPLLRLAITDSDVETVSRASLVSVRSNTTAAKQLPGPATQVSLSDVKYFQLARKCIDQSLARPSIETVVGLVTLSTCAAAHGDPSGVLYLGLAIRTAQLIHLHREPAECVDLPSASYQQELARRVWWMVYDLDCHSSFLLNMPSAIDDRDVLVGLPSVDGFINDKTFRRSKPSTSSAVALYALYVRLVRILARTVEFVRMRPRMGQSQANLDRRLIALALATWVQSSPRWMRTVCAAYSDHATGNATAIEPKTPAPTWNEAYTQAMSQYIVVMLNREALDARVAGAAARRESILAVDAQGTGTGRTANMFRREVDSDAASCVRAAMFITDLVERFLATNSNFLNVRPFISRYIFDSAQLDVSGFVICFMLIAGVVTVTTASRSSAAE
nr:hypothetical protein HK105_000343 [Polyrhizophydium stewartii]